MHMTPGAKFMTAGCRDACPGRAAMAGPTVSAGFARGLLELAVSKGADRRRLAEEAQIAPGDLADQDARIPFARYVALMRAGKALSGDPALGLHYGEQVDISDVSIVGLLGQASASAGEALVQLNRYVRLIVETDTGGDPLRFRPIAEGGRMWLVDTRLDPNAFPELSESAFAQLVCGRRRVDPRPVVKSVQFAHADPGYRSEYERIFQAPVAFGARRNAMELVAGGEGELKPRLPRYVFGVLAERADALLAELEAARTTRSRVESLLLPLLHTGEIGMDAVAARLGMSRQTLFRRLKAEGATFETVLDELRRRMALDYLAARKVSVTEAAYLVGFSDPAAFSRAFKRWTGGRPGAFRISASESNNVVP